MRSPVRRKFGVADPRLQVSGNGLPRCDDRFGCREEQEVSAVHLHFRAEKSSARRAKRSGLVKITVISISRSGHCGFTLLRADVVHNRFAGRRGSDSKALSRSVVCGYCHFRVAESISTSEGGVQPGGKPAVCELATESSGKTVIDLDLHVGNVRQRRGDQTGDGSSGEHRGLAQNKVIRGLRLQFVDARRARQRSPTCRQCFRYLPALVFLVLQRLPKRTSPPKLRTLQITSHCGNFALHAPYFFS